MGEQFNIQCRNAVMVSNEEEESPQENEIIIDIQNISDDTIYFNSSGQVSDIDDPFDAATSRFILYFPLCTDDTPPDLAEQTLTSTRLAGKINCRAEVSWEIERYFKTKYGYYWIIYPYDYYVSVEPNETISITFDRMISYLSPNQLTFAYFQFNDEPWEYVPIAKVPRKLEILKFDCNQTFFSIGDRVTLNWSVAGAERCYISLFHENLPFQGQQTFYFRESTGFMLCAENDSAMIEQELYLSTYEETPQINNFYASKKEIALGDTVTLYFELYHTDHAFIDNGIGYVTGTSIDIKPTETKKYRIYLEGAARGTTDFFGKTCKVAVNLI